MIVYQLCISPSKADPEGLDCSEWFRTLGEARTRREMLIRGDPDLEQSRHRKDFEIWRFKVNGKVRGNDRVLAVLNRDNWSEHSELVVAAYEPGAECGPDPISAAKISSCGRYRYRLQRIWDPGAPWCAWVMLNPSTADATKDDATIRKCVGFSKRWGFGGIVVVNCFAYRTADPKDLTRVLDPYGPENDQALAEVGDPRVGMVVAAWGTRARWGRGENEVRGDTRTLDALTSQPGVEEKIHALRITKEGFPQHPLYVPYTARPVRYPCPQ